MFAYSSQSCNGIASERLEYSLYSQTYSYKYLCCWQLLSLLTDIIRIDRTIFQIHPFISGKKETENMGLKCLDFGVT